MDFDPGRGLITVESGIQWPELIDWIEKWPLQKKLIDQKDLNPLFLARHCSEAMRIIKKAHQDYQEGGTDFCINYTKYKIDQR